MIFDRLSLVSHTCTPFSFPSEILTPMISANTKLPIESTQPSSIATCNVGTKNLSTRNQEATCICGHLRGTLTKPHHFAGPGLMLGWVCLLVS